MVKNSKGMHTHYKQYKDLCFNVLLLSYNFILFVWIWFLVWVCILRLLGDFLLNSNTNLREFRRMLKKKKKECQCITLP